MPVTGTTVPMVEADLAAEVQHQGFQRRGGVKLKTDGVQFLFGRNHVGPEATQVFHQHQRVLLFFKEPDRHESGKITVAPVVTQEHFRGWKRRPLGDGIHFDRGSLLISEHGRVKTVPRDVFVHVPAHGFQLFKEFRIEHDNLSKLSKF